MWDFKSVYFSKFFLYFFKTCFLLQQNFYLIICIWRSYGFPQWPLDLQTGIFNSLDLPLTTLTVAVNLRICWFLFNAISFLYLSLFVDCFVIPWENLTGLTFSFLFLSIFIIAQSIIYQLLSCSNTKQWHKTSPRTSLLFMAPSVTHCYCDISAVSLFMQLSRCHHAPLAQSYAVSHWCPFYTIHFTKWIHYVLGKVHFSNE